MGIPVEMVQFLLKLLLKQRISWCAIRFPLIARRYEVVHSQTSFTLSYRVKILERSEWTFTSDSENLVVHLTWPNGCYCSVRSIAVATSPVALRCMCDSPRKGCARRITPINMWREQATIEWSWHVISIVACCHGVKLCALAPVQPEVYRVTSLVSFHSMRPFNRNTPTPIIARECACGWVIHSDAYSNLNAMRCQHSSGNHQQQYVDPATGAHTQTVELSWLDAKAVILKRMWGVSRKLFQSHLDHFC